MGEGVSEQAIDALVRRLRDRLAEVDPNGEYIVTVRGHGFRMDNPE
jgi:DNA-binding response OmpR family regulator